MIVDISYPENNGLTKTKSHVTIQPRDLWDGSETLAIVIHAWLKRYRALYNHKRNPLCSYPPSFCTEPYDEHQDEESQMKAWLDALDAMIYSFHHCAYAYWSDGPTEKLFHKEHAELEKINRKLLKRARLLDDTEAAERKKNKTDAGGYESHYWNLHMHILDPLYHKYHPLFEEHHNKVQYGLDLFAKHFKSLWT